MLLVVGSGIGEHDICPPGNGAQPVFIAPPLSVRWPAGLTPCPGYMVAPLKVLLTSQSMYILNPGDDATDGQYEIEAVLTFESMQGMGIGFTGKGFRLYADGKTWFFGVGMCPILPFLYRVWCLVHNVGARILPGGSLHTSPFCRTGAVIFWLC